MANTFYSLNRGQEIGAVDLVAATTVSTAAADVELRVSTTNSITINEVVILLEAIEDYLLSLGLESQPGVNLPAQTFPG